jgi:hypothetical protein
LFEVFSDKETGDEEESTLRVQSENHRPTLAGASDKRQRPGCDHRKRGTSMSCESESKHREGRKARRANNIHYRPAPGENFAQKDDFKVQQEALWRWAAERVPPWSKLQRDDYDFPWTNHAPKQLLEAGCIYEYARESRKLRGLLVLMNPRRKREPFETMVPSRTGRVRHLPCSFEGLREEDARRTLRGALRWLRGYADELAENKSFADLLRTRKKEVTISITERPLHFPLKAIQLAFLHLWDYGEPPPWPWQPWTATLFSGEVSAKGLTFINIPDRSIHDDGSEKIAIHVRWRDFRNSEIGEEMKKLVELHRPTSEPEPNRKGQKPEDTIRAYMKALSVMRICKLHKGKPWKKLELVAKVCGYKGCVSEAAEYKSRCKEGRGDRPMGKTAQTEMSDARSRALKFFQRLFPGETPSNY